MSGKIFRIGQGFDTHRLMEGRRLILGGVEIPHPKGLAGHSDADVLIHALIDALLGAAGLGDIGEFFPDTDPAYKDISSSILLRQVHLKLHKEGWEIVNIDATLILEKPKLLPFKRQIIASLAEVLCTSDHLISLKAKTAEKMGALGREEGIAALVVVMIQKRES
ncbi:MAG: 2-C-methyl-D-erythritol 2,4-cyclodiphosphate synthase [Candidatus Caenarcaniphilales bacterium]|nr:2-C-methyl-D-erythritol 2,4-cyclodiphosphate synthase [Candidatus Caenarcaniphilales bacterium]